MTPSPTGASTPSRPWLLPLRPLLLAGALGACGGEPDAPPPPPPPTASTVEQVAEGPGPISSSPHRWAWVPFSDSRCMNGSATGLGLNLSSTSDKVLVFLEGGGACFNAFSCANMVANPGGFSLSHFSAWASQRGARGLFDRADSDNPFRDWSFVYVPYCSGDVHAGNHPGPTGPTGRVHLGAANLSLYLQRLVPTFSSASQVVLSGSSAGGAGATLNYDRVQRAFGSTPVLLLNDSAPVFSDTWLKPCLQRQWRDAWKLDDTLPPDCAECRGQDGGLLHLLPFLARKYPERRMALVVSDADSTFRAFYGFGYSPSCTELVQMPADDFRQGLAELRDSLAPTPNFRLYSPASSKHVYLGDSPLGLTTLSGVRLTDWLRSFLSEEPGWEHVSPQENGTLPLLGGNPLLTGEEWNGAAQSTSHR